MTEWIVFALVAYGLVSFSNIIDKLLVEKYIKDSSIVVLFSGGIAFLSGLVILALRGFPVFSIKDSLIIIIAGVFLVLYLIPYYKALKIDDTSRVVPLFQSVPIFTLILSFFLLQESISYRQIIGFVIILCSGFLLSVQKVQNVITFKKSFWLMMISSIIYAISSVLFKYIVGIQDIWDSIAYESIGIGIGTLLIAILPGFIQRFKKTVRRLPISGWLALSLGELFYIIFRFLIAFAILFGSVSLVNVIGGTQPVFLLIYGVILTKIFPKIIREDISQRLVRLKLVAIFMIFVGLYLVY